MAEIDAKVNMSLDDIIKLERKDKKKKGMVNGKGVAKNKRQGKPRQRGNNNNSNSIRGRGANNSNNNNKNKKNVNGQKKSQAWRLQRQPLNNNFVTKRYKQNGGLKRAQSKTNLNLNNKNATKNKPTNQQQSNNNGNRSGFVGRRAAAVARPTGRVGLTRSRSRNNIAPTKRFLTAPKGLKRVNSLPNLRDPNSVYNRLGYQSPAQAAYRSRVKRAKQVLLQRQNQRLLPNDRLVPRPVKALTTLQQRALERRQQILTTQRPYNTGGLRSDQILRAQRRAQYTQKLMRMNAARVNPNPNVNFMCTLGDNYAPGTRSRSMNPDGGLHSLRQLPRGRSPFRQNSQNLNSLSRGSLFNRPRPRPRSRSRSRSRSRTRTVPLIHSGTNVDDRTFSEVMYSVSNNLGVTGRTLNDRFTF